MRALRYLLSTLLSHKLNLKDLPSRAVSFESFGCSQKTQTQFGYFRDFRVRHWNGPTAKQSNTTEST